MSHKIISLVAAAILLHTVSSQGIECRFSPGSEGCGNNDDDVKVVDGPRVISTRKNTQTTVSSDQHNDNNDQLQWSPPKKPKHRSSEENDGDNNDEEQWSPPKKPKYGYSQDGLNDEENEHNDEEQWSPPKKPKPPTIFEDNNELTTEETNNDEEQKIRLRLGTQDEDNDSFNEDELQKIRLRFSTNDNENNNQQIPIRIKPKAKAKVTFDASEMVELDVTSSTRVFEQLKEQIMQSNNE